MKRWIGALGILVVTVVAAAIVLRGLGFGPRRPPASTVPVAEVSVDGASIREAEPLVFADSDWPQWRGPRNDGTAVGQNVPIRWDATTNVAWTADVPGRGHASPIVIGGTVFLASAISDQQKQLVIAFDRATGERRWETVVHEGGFPDPSEVHQKATHANGTLASDGQRIFAAFFNSGKIIATALDFDGHRIWQQEVGAFSSKFGYAPSPVIYQATVIVAADNWGGGYLAALDRETGAIVWRKARPAISTYSSPLLASISGRDQLVISGCNRLISYNPATGDELWSCGAIAEATCGTPVTDGTVIVASGGYPERQTICVKGDGSGQTMWSNNTRVYEPSLVTTGEHVFAVTDEGIACCWSTKTGDELWKKRLGGSFSASPVTCNGVIYAANLSGETIVFAAKGDAYHELARNQLGDDCYASPAVSANELFLRVGFGGGRQRQERLVCIRQP